MDSKIINKRYFKFLGMIETLRNQNYDWIMWLDADTLILNHSKNLDTAMDDRYDVVLTSGPPDEKRWKNIVNSGAFLVKNSKFGIEFLHDIMTWSGKNCNEFMGLYPQAKIPINGWLRACNPKTGRFWLNDQGVVQAVFYFKEPQYKCHIKQVHFQHFNSEYPWVVEKDMIVHLPGRKHANRKEIINIFLKNADFETGKIAKSAQLSFVKLQHTLDEFDKLYDSEYNVECSSLQV